MISKNLFSILCAILVWVLGVGFYLFSYYIPFLENPELQSNIILALGIIPSACLGTYLFYRNHYMKPSALAITFVIVATVLDVLITVPAFIIPYGGSYSKFFGDPMFYTIVVEFYFIVLYFGTHLTKKIKA
jgi:uncharacterized membrane protein